MQVQTLHHYWTRTTSPYFDVLMERQTSRHFFKGNIVIKSKTVFSKALGQKDRLNSILKVLSIVQLALPRRLRDTVIEAVSFLFNYVILDRRLDYWIGESGEKRQTDCGDSLHRFCRMDLLIRYNW